MGNLFGDGSSDLGAEKARLAAEQFLAPFSQDAIPMHELVRRVREGDPGLWGQTSSEMNAVAMGHNDTVHASQQMQQALEASWSGEGAESAAQAVKAGQKANEAAGEVYARNAEHFTSNASSFERIKNSLPDVPAEVPQPGFVDAMWPWETDVEAQHREAMAATEAAREIYSGHEGSVHRSAYSVDGDFGQIRSLGGDFGGIERGGASGDGAGVISINEPGGGGSNGDRGGGGSVGGGGPVGGGSVNGGSYPGGDGPSTGANWSPSTSSNDSTGSSGLTSPQTGQPPAANYPGGSIPGGGVNTPGTNMPGGSGSNVTGFGPLGAPRVGGGGFGSAGSPTGGGFGSRSGAVGGRLPGGAGAGGAAGGAGSGSGAGGQGAGRMTGAGPGFGPTGGGGAGAGGATAGGGTAGGRGGMMGGGMMGGGAGRGGQGSEDEDHRRKYVAETDEHFALTEGGEVLRDPVTGNVVVPHTIGE